MTQAAVNGYVIAQRHLAEWYARGGVIRQDYALAMKWYLKAAEQGDVVAMYAIGKMYDQGDGVVKDHAEALRWYQKVTDTRNAPR